MYIFYHISDHKAFLDPFHKISTRLVPTMGALHGAHLSLIEESKQQDDLTLCSIFVNPDQFDRKEDWMNYARFPEKDITFLESADCDTCFFVLCSGDLS